MVKAEAYRISRFLSLVYCSFHGEWKGGKQLFSAVRGSYRAEMEPFKNVLSNVSATTGVTEEGEEEAGKKIAVRGDRRGNRESENEAHTRQCR